MSGDTPDPQATAPEAVEVKRPFGRLDLAWLFLLGLSGFATFEGLATHVGAGGVSMSPLAVFFCLTVVLLLTGAMGVTADYAFGGHKHEVSPTGRIATACVYAACAFLSLTFAFAWWWGMLGAREATNSQVDKEIARVESGLRQTRQQLSTARGQLDLLARVSTERATVEAKQGGTCGPQGRGTGPVTRLRQANALLFGQIAADTGERITTLDRSMTESLGIVSQLRKGAASADADTRTAKLMEVRKQLTELAGQVSALASDPGLRAYDAEMETLANAYRKQGGHAADGGAALTCIDVGIASALDGARAALSGIRAVPAPEFAIYEGNQSTNEAMRRFVATLFGWAAPKALGEGISGGNEYLAFALALIVDGLLLWVTLRRGEGLGNSGPEVHLRRAEAAIAKRRIMREAEQLLVTDQAVAHSTAMVALADSAVAPFVELIVDHDGRTYLIVPTVAPSTAASAQAREILGIASRLDAERKSGVREQISFVWRHFSLFSNRDQKARNALRALGGNSIGWAQGTGFRWFAITDTGLRHLASWAQATNGSSGVLQGGETMHSALARESQALAELNSDTLRHRANLAEARLDMQRRKQQAELEAYHHASQYRNAEKVPTSGETSIKPIWNWDHSASDGRVGRVEPSEESRER